MRLKVDEKAPREVCELLQGAGHDAISVGAQGLGGAGDARAYRLGQDEQRALITLDVDFANVHAQSSFGVLVLRLARQDRARVPDAVARALPVLEREPPAQRLWIVEAGRIRIRA